MLSVWTCRIGKMSVFLQLTLYRSRRVLRSLQREVQLWVWAAKPLAVCTPPSSSPGRGKTRLSSRQPGRRTDSLCSICRTWISRIGVNIAARLSARPSAGAETFKSMSIVSLTHLIAAIVPHCHFICFKSHLLNLLSRILSNHLEIAVGVEWGVNPNEDTRDRTKLKLKASLYDSWKTEQQTNGTQRLTQQNLNWEKQLKPEYMTLKTGWNGNLRHETRTGTWKLRPGKPKHEIPDLTLATQTTRRGTIHTICTRRVTREAQLAGDTVGPNV